MVPTWSDTGNLASAEYPGEAAGSPCDRLLAFVLCRIIRKYIRIVINADAIMLPTIARAA